MTLVPSNHVSILEHVVRVPTSEDSSAHANMGTKDQTANLVSMN